jgi:hypothetical protein
VELVVELLIECGHWIFMPVLWLFGYDKDWDPVTERAKHHHRLLSILLPFGLFALCLAALIGLGFWLHGW